MEISILSDMKDQSAGRREISFSVVQEGRTASRDEITQELCRKLNLSPDATIITDIKQEFGVRRSTGVAHSYASKEQLDKAEPKYLIARLAKRGKKAEGAEQPKEEPKQGAGNQAAPQAAQKHDKPKKEEAEKKE